MLSTKYRLRVESICQCISDGEEVEFDDMLWVHKLAKVNVTVNEMLKKAHD